MKGLTPMGWRAAFLASAAEIPASLTSYTKSPEPLLKQRILLGDTIEEMVRRLGRR